MSGGNLCCLGETYTQILDIFVREGEDWCREYTCVGRISI